MDAEALLWNVLDIKCLFWMTDHVGLATPLKLIVAAALVTAASITSPIYYVKKL